MARSGTVGWYVPPRLPRSVPPAAVRFLRARLMPDAAANWSNFLDHAALSDLGLRSANNQDSFAVVPAGDEQDFRQRGTCSWWPMAWEPTLPASWPASWLATASRTPTTSCSIVRLPTPALRQAIIETNAHIHGRGEANAEFHGMGTTTSVLVMLPQGAPLGHIGDSRVYRLRNRTLDQLTFDHSLVWEMKASGQLPPGTAADFVPKNIITRSLGPHAEVKVDLEVRFRSNPATPSCCAATDCRARFATTRLGQFWASCCRRRPSADWFNLANLNGGPDNITVIVIRVVKPLVRAPQDREFRSPAAARRGWPCIRRFWSWWAWPCWPRWACSLPIAGSRPESA